MPRPRVTLSRNGRISGGAVGPPNAISRTASSADEIDEPTLDVDAEQLDGHPVADVHSGKPAHHAALDRRRWYPHPRSFRGRARDEAGKALAETVHEQEGGGRLADLALDLGRVVFLLGTMAGHVGQSLLPRRGRAAHLRRP